MTDTISQERLIALGGVPMFATKDSMEEAMEYIIELGKAVGDGASVTTAVFVYLNTYITQRELREKSNET